MEYHNDKLPELCEKFDIAVAEYNSHHYPSRLFKLIDLCNQLQTELIAGGDKGREMQAEQFRAASKLKMSPKLDQEAV